MADVFREVDEEVRADQYRALWRAYGRYVVAGLVLVVLFTGAVTYWRYYTDQQRLDEAIKFSGALALAGDGYHGDAASAFADLAAESSAGYAILSRFQEAAALSAVGDGSGAVAVYERLIADGAIDAHYRDLAIVLAASIALDEGGSESLWQGVERLAGGATPWRPLARELQALSALKAGDKATAREIYSLLIEEATTPPGVKARAGEMLDWLSAAIG